MGNTTERLRRELQMKLLQRLRQGRFPMAFAS